MPLTQAELESLLGQPGPVNLAGQNLSGVVLRDADLSHADLSGANLNGAELVGCNLTGANLTGADLAGANLSWADLRGARLLAADLSKTVLSGANLSGVDLTGVRSADASGGGLPNTQSGLFRVNFSGAALTVPQRLAAREHGAVLDGMTEPDWLTCPYAGPMLQFVRDWLSPRKQVLLATASNRAEFLDFARTYPGEVGDLGLRALETAERFVDGQATVEELATLRQDAERIMNADPYRWDLFHNTQPDRLNCIMHILDVARGLTTLLDIDEGMGQGHPFTLLGQSKDHTDLVRDVFGNPFRAALVVDPGWLAWNDGTVRALCRSIYEEKTFERMPILGDALEEAGCTNDTVLGHCRGPGPHIRGCFLLDALLGKS